MKKNRGQAPLWVLMSACFTLILSLTLITIILVYRTALSSRYRSGLRDQLYRGLEQLEAADYSPEALTGVEDQGIRVLVLEAETGTVLHRNRDGIPILDEDGNERSETQRGHRDLGCGDHGMTETVAELVRDRLGQAEGSFFISDRELGSDEVRRDRALESKELYLCGRSGRRIFCLNLPVESTNAAVNLAIRYATLVGINVWFASLVVFYFLSKFITRPHRRIADTAAQIAELDFSRRCPSAVTTELNDMGQSINRMADSLEANVNELRDANERMQTELNERIRQQQLTAELIANLSHDLKTPIAIISGYAEGLLEGVARTPEKQQTYYEMILRESDHMQSIVSRILALGRMESGETPIRIETFDLIRLLDDLRDSFQRELERSGIVPEHPDWPETCWVRTDYTCARQSILNYLQNAVSHINGGSRVEIRIEDRGDMIRFRVTNSSAPIPEAEAARLWDKLYRGDPSRQRHNGEMGLGLSIVKGNMERLGHPYGFENDPAFPGVCFWLELPKAPGPEAL